MATTISAIYRYPVKGLSAEPLHRVMLSPGRCLPHDRRFAIALPSTQFDPRQPQWLAKTHFVMLMRDAKLARLHTRFEAASSELTIEHDGEIVCRGRLSEPDGCIAVSDYLTAFLAPHVAGPLRIVEAPDHTFADARRKPNATTDQYVSLINLRSIGALEALIAAPVDRLRFRANVYFDGAADWRELDWLESEIALGATRLRVVSAITRCAATEVDPSSAERDLDILGALRRGFGHNLMGIYAEVISPGEIAVRDTLTVLPRQRFG